MSSSHFDLATIAAGCFLLMTTFADAGVNVRGTPEATRVEAHEASIEEVLRALSDTYSFRYVSNIPLRQIVTGTYNGPLSRVLSFLLSGRNFVLKHESKGLRLVIISEAGPEKSWNSAEAVRSPAPVHNVLPPVWTKVPLARRNGEIEVTKTP
jgi:hypothetical protein